MLEFGTLPAVVQALLIVTAVVIEAAALYVGYGYVEDLFGPHVIETIEKV